MRTLFFFKPLASLVETNAHKTILQALYQVAFRKKNYKNIDEIQYDLDEWERFYNEERTHQGKISARTVMQTLLEDKYTWIQNC
jgi:alpha-L-arabinofuranosidase